jgi:hypothetical protein
MAEQHSGLSLDQYWDLYVSEKDGDLGIDRRVDEVQKDISLLVARLLTGEGEDNSGVAGSVVDSGRAGDIELRVRKLILADPRIDTVSDVTVDTNQQSGDFELTIVATLGSFIGTVETDIDDDGTDETVQFEFEFVDGELIRGDVIGDV